MGLRGIEDYNETYHTTHQLNCRAPICLKIMQDVCFYEKTSPADFFQKSVLGYAITPLTYCVVHFWQASKFT